MARREWVYFARSLKKMQRVKLLPRVRNTAVRACLSLSEQNSTKCPSRPPCNNFRALQTCASSKYETILKRRHRWGKSAVNAAPVSFDDHFYETVHGAHNFSQQLYPHHHYKDDSVHGSTYSESAHGGSHYSGSIHGKQGEDHSVHGTTALAGMLDNTLGGFGDDLFIGANDTLEDADADMMAVLLNEGGKVEEVPQLIVKLRVGKDTIRFRLLHKWSDLDASRSYSKVDRLPGFVEIEVHGRRR